MLERSSVLSALVGLAVLVAVAAGCSSAAKPTVVPEPVVEKTQAPLEPQGTLVVAHPESFFSTLDPQAKLSRHSWNVFNRVYDTLVDFNSEALEASPRLATEWELLDENTWKFTLRQDVKFHNGEPFTSECVKFTLDRMVNPDTRAAQASLWARYDHTETPDPHTAIVKTKSPMATMLSTLSLTPMLPSGAGPTMDFDNDAIGTGRFKLVKWVRDEHLTLEANMDYWGEIPKLKTYVDKWIPEVSTRMAALEAGDVNFVATVPIEDVPRLEESSEFVVASTPTVYERFIWMNPQREPFDNPKVREAMRYGINVQAMLDTISKGEGERSGGCVSEGVFGFCAKEPYPYDPEKAKVLLAEAGYPEGFSTTLIYVLGLSKQTELAEIIASDLAKIGVEVEIVLLEEGAWLEDILALNFDMSWMGTVTLTGDADFTLRRLYHSQNKRTGYNNPDLDALLDAQAGELDLSRRAQLLCDACNILWDDGPTVWFWSINEYYAYRDSVKGFEPHKNSFIHFEDMWVE